MTDAITENKQELNERVSEIQGNRDLNDEAKRRMLEEAYNEAANRHAELVAEREEADARELAESERAVFALSYPKSAATEGQREVYRQSYRDAAFRVWNMSEQDLDRMLGRAERTGDRMLAQAIYHEAVDRGITSVKNRYRNTNPDALKRWEKYVAARGRRDSVEGLFATALETQAPEVMG